MEQLIGDGPSTHAKEVFAALSRSKNVLIAGPPGTGKTRLLAEITFWFKEAPGVGFNSKGDIPFPADKVSDFLPSPDRTDRKSFRVIFHPGTRYRHLLRGLEPVPNASGSFRYSKGTLYDANEHAMRPDGTALLVIDEINRGPAVEAFGDAIVSIEADKRLDDKNSAVPQSYPTRIPSDAGELVDYYFSPHLYLLASMNSADASVAPMDVAFLRRWEPFELLPDVNIAKDALGLTQSSGSSDGPQELLSAFVDAWEQVNDRISLLRGAEYQLGHAVAVPESGRELSELIPAMAFVGERWSQIERHVHELFFGDPRAEVAVLGGMSEEMYRISEGYLRTELTTRVIRPKLATPEDWTLMLKAVAARAQ
ncbi:MAG: AAA family ATPase [Caldilineaceae bacterium]|nr:AAA family ATPase [Caldilineaceae bacterium]